jgi:hypothetical protein
LRAKRSNPAARRQARKKNALNPRLMLEHFVGPLRARWIASSLRSSQ